MMLFFYLLILCAVVALGLGGLFIWALNLSPFPTHEEEDQDDE